MYSFKTFFNEKSDIKVGGGWSIVTLDDGTELSTNMELLSKGNIQVHKPKAKSTTIHVGKNPIQSIEDELGYSLPDNDKDLEAFLTLLPCPCEN